MKKNNQRGFSLIELSIVLIIIGLLVAGITGGATLIRSAELRSIMTEARGYRIAINAYFTSEDELPGDGNDTTGDANARIESNNGSDLLEGAVAWEDMEAEDVVDFNATAPTQTGDETPSLAVGTAIPEARYTGGGWALDFSATMNSNILILTRSTYEQAGTTATVDELVPTVILTGDDATSVDRKMDDGDLTSGRVEGVDAFDTGGDLDTEPTGAAETCAAGTTEVCALAFRLEL